MEGQVKTLTVRRDRVGNWDACFAREVPEHPLSMCESVVGVDVGRMEEKLGNPCFFRKDELALAKAKRRMAKAEKGHPNKPNAEKGWLIFTNG